MAGATWAYRETLSVRWVVVRPGGPGSAGDGGAAAGSRTGGGRGPGAVADAAGRRRGRRAGHLGAALALVALAWRGARLVGARRAMRPAPMGRRRATAGTRLAARPSALEAERAA